MTQPEKSANKNLKALTLAYEFYIQISSDENSPRHKNKIGETRNQNHRLTWVKGNCSELAPHLQTLCSTTRMANL
jgi:hypothetical protein